MFVVTGFRDFLSLQLVLLLLIVPTFGRKHHEQLSGAQADMVWVHVFLQMAVWGILFPAGMVLGMTRSRWHVPLQSAGFVLTSAGYWLGHSHGGRSLFHSAAHRVNAYILVAPMAVQLVLGIYLKLGFHERTVRPLIVRIHGAVGKTFPILGWVQMILGMSTLRGYCVNNHLGECLTYYGMGSSFIAYAVVIAIVELAGGAWVRRIGKSPEWWDSCTIVLFGFITLCTGIAGIKRIIFGSVWLAGGLLGLYLASNNQRTVVPSIILIVTGCAFAANSKEPLITHRVIAAIGYTLLAAGIARITEIFMISPDVPSFLEPSDGNSTHYMPVGQASHVKQRSQAAKAFVHLPPFLLTSAGVLSISATKEQLHAVTLMGIAPFTYIIIMLSCAFLLYSLIFSLIQLYATSGRNAQPGSALEDPEDSELGSMSASKGYALVPDEHEESHIIGDED